jgi:hypothetical protein
MSDGLTNLAAGDGGVDEVHNALRELDEQLRAAAAPAPATAPVVHDVFETRRLLERRTEGRIRFLRTIKYNRDPPLNTHEPRVVELFNELLHGAKQLSNYEFQLKAHELILKNQESLRPRVSVYVEEMLDEVGVYDGHARRRVAELILTPTPHERADPASRQREFFLYVDQARFNAWKAALAERHGGNPKIVWKEHRNPYRPGNMHDSMML